MYGINAYTQSPGSPSGQSLFPLAPSSASGDEEAWSDSPASFIHSQSSGFDPSLSPFTASPAPEYEEEQLHTPEPFIYLDTGVTANNDPAAQTTPSHLPRAAALNFFSTVGGTGTANEMRIYNGAPGAPLRNGFREIVNEDEDADSSSEDDFSFHPRRLTFADPSTTFDLNRELENANATIDPQVFRTAFPTAVQTFNFPNDELDFLDHSSDSPVALVPGNTIDHSQEFSLSNLPFHPDGSPDALVPENTPEELGGSFGFPFPLTHTRL